MLLRADDRSIYARHDAEGMCCVRTKQTIILAHYPPSVQAGEATKIVEQLADYLIGAQYWTRSTGCMENKYLDILIHIYI